MLARSLGLGKCNGASRTCFTGDVGGHVVGMVKLHPLQGHAHAATPKLSHNSILIRYSRQPKGALL